MSETIPECEVQNNTAAAAPLAQAAIPPRLHKPFPQLSPELNG